MEDDVDEADGVDLGGVVDMQKDGNDDEGEYEAQADKEEVEEEDEDEEEDQDEDDSKEPRTLGQGEIVHTSADDVDILVNDEPVVVPDQAQQMRAHTPLPQPQVRAPHPQTFESCPQS
jgi:hypothetical protein